MLWIWLYRSLVQRITDFVDLGQAHREAQNLLSMLHLISQSHLDMCAIAAVSQVSICRQSHLAKVLRLILIWVISGHWIQDCPTNSDPDYRNKPRIKRTTGIPKSFLQTVEGPAADGENQAGLMVTADGNFVIARPDA